MNSILTEVTPLSDKDCFYIADRKKSEFTYPIHCHSEYELNFVKNASGVQRIVGDSVEVIGEYDLVLIANGTLEHGWIQQECKSKSIREITIQFSHELFFNNFIHKSQFGSIRHMLEMGKKGLCFPMEAIMKVYAKLDTLASQEGFYAVIDLLTILHELSLFSDFSSTLATSSFAKTDLQSDSRRIAKVKEYVNKHFSEEIKLEDVTDIIGMAPAAFSRFFKLSTGKTFSKYLIDIRLGHASLLLVNTTMSVAEICYKCGYNNVSNFNRLFKENKKVTPSEFRENYQKKRILI
ncbi:AraC family transcriptional regulator [Dysgonomonas sp. Marseille-P4361]|uniref:AraC family transcriptional regulator n=1 Tax=Dysgonomonas sp. Marseille-P4361 TaxID=2161820 RepID=UPI000D561825|nr:AraC family transcriptional regulator [Dysgonomonas sp. Marseille-P4361]